MATFFPFATAAEGIGCEDRAGKLVIPNSDVLSYIHSFTDPPCLWGQF